MPVAEAKAIAKQKLPDEGTLQAFWTLASDNVDGQAVAVKKLCETLRTDNTHLNYCVGRLLKGLASARPHARVGFGQALMILLQRKVVEPELVVAEIPKHLKLSADELFNEAIGRALAYLTVLQSATATEDRVVLDMVNSVNELRSLKIEDKKKPLLELLCLKFFALAAKSLGRKGFKNSLLPLISEDILLSEPADLNKLFLVLELSSAHAKRLPDQTTEFLSGLENNETVAQILGAVANRGASGGFHPVARSIVEYRSKTPQTLESFLSDVVVGKFLKSGQRFRQMLGLHALTVGVELSKSVQDAELLLSGNPLSAVVNLSTKGASHTFASAVDEFLAAFVDAMSDKDKSDGAKLKMLRCVMTSHPHFDRVTNSTALSAALNTSVPLHPALAFNMIADFPKVAKGEVSAPKIAAYFKLLESLKLPPKSPEFLLILKFFGAVGFFDDTKALGGIDIKIPAWITKRDGDSNDPASKVRAAALSKIDDMCAALCKISRTKGASQIHVSFSPENFDVLRSYIKWLRKQEVYEEMSEAVASDWNDVYDFVKNVDYGSLDNPGKAAAALAIYLLLWTLRMPDSFAPSLAEILTISKSDRNSPGWLSVMIDFLVGQLSLPHRFVRPVAQVAFYYLSEMMTDLQSIQPILDVLDVTKKASDLMRPSGEDDGEFDEITENELSNGFEILSDASDADEVLSEEEVAKFDVDVDPEFRDRLQAALIEAGMAPDGSDAEGLGAAPAIPEGPEDLDDEAMMALDSKLGAIFRSYVSDKAGSKVKKQSAEDLRAFRSKLFDLLSLFIHSNAPLSVRITLHPKLIWLSQKALQEKEQTAIFNRTQELAREIVRLRLHEKVTREAPVEIATAIFDVAAELRNPVLQHALSDGIGLALRLLSSQNDPEVKEKFVATVTEQMDKFFIDRSYNIGSTLFSVCFKRAPDLFCKSLPSIAGYLTKDIPPIRKTDITSLITDFFEQNADWQVDGQSWTETKIFSKFCKKFKSALTEQQGLIASEPGSLKPRYFGSLVNVIAVISKRLPREKLNKIVDDILPYLATLAGKSSWTAEPLSRCERVISVNNNGKRPYQVVKAILAKVGHESEDAKSGPEEPPTKKVKTEEKKKGKKKMKTESGEYVDPASAQEN